MTAAVRVFQPVGVGIGAEVLGGQGAEGIAAHRFPEEILPRTAPPGQRAAVPEVEIIGPFHMDVADVFGDAFDLRHLPERAEGIRRGPGQQFQTAPEGQPGVAVILRALVAAAVSP